MAGYTKQSPGGSSGVGTQGLYFVIYPIRDKHDFSADVNYNIMCQDISFQIKYKRRKTNKITSKYNKQTNHPLK